LVEQHSGFTEQPMIIRESIYAALWALGVGAARFAAAALAKTFRSRSARKIYWALVAGVPRPRQGRISTFLAKEEREDESFMRIAQHGEEGASHAVTFYAVVETAGPKLAWLSLKPVTGRTHQLRAHMVHIGHPIVGDPKYFSIENRRGVCKVGLFVISIKMEKLFCRELQISRTRWW